jgi:hypothetical protein
MQRTPAPSHPPPIGWFAFVRGHFRQTRGPLAFGLCGAILLAPLLSLVKPAVGGKAMVALAIGLAVLTAVLLVAYVFSATREYVSRTDRRLRDDETSGLAMLAWSCLWLTIGVGPISFAESRSPPTGWLVEFVPELHEEQVRWLGVAPHPSLEPSLGPSTSVPTVASPSESRETSEHAASAARLESTALPESAARPESASTAEAAKSAIAKPTSSDIASSQNPVAATEAAAKNDKFDKDTGNPFELEDEAAPAPALSPAAPAKSTTPAPPSPASKADDQNPFETDP